MGVHDDPEKNEPNVFIKLILDKTISTVTTGTKAFREAVSADGDSSMIVRKNNDESKMWKPAADGSFTVHKNTQFSQDDPLTAV